MTRRGKIRAFFKVLSEHLGIEFVRGEQSGERPKYPFLSYKILSSDAGKEQEAVKTSELIDDDKLKKTSIRESALIVSISFFSDEKMYETLIELAEKAYAWVDSLTGYEAAKKIGIGVSVESPVQDRTVFFETEYEYRFGFDIKIRDKAIYTEIVETIDIDQLVENLRN